MNKYLITCCVVAWLALFGAESYAIGPEFTASYQAAVDLPGSIPEFQIILENDTVGAATLYRLKFVIAGDSLPARASLEFDFPPYFDLNEIDSVRVTNTDGDSSQFTVVDYEVGGLHLSVELDSIGNLPEPGTQITVLAYGIMSSQTAGQYEVLIAVLRPDGQLVALPRLSEPFTLRPGPLAQFSVSPKGIQQLRAGTTLSFTPSWRDQFGNNVTGGPVTWGVIGNPIQAGTMEGSSFLAKFVGQSRVFATYGQFADTSGLIYVLPGSFAYYSFVGGADSAVAGQNWRDGDDDITVTAHDLYGNVQYDHEEEVYFESTDPTATLPHSESTPFAFTELDQGIKIFSGSGFRFTRAGRHELRLMKDGAIQKSIYPIAIRAAAPSAYNLSLAGSATAGVDVPIQITGAIDPYGNPISGQAVVTLINGDGVSPSGVLPSLPSFAVINGSGSGVIRLVKSGSAAIRINLSGVIANRNLSVAPASTVRFQFDMDPTQPINQPFVGTAQITALDSYGNIAESFTAATDSVTITCTGSGQMADNIFAASNSFIAGVCDLTRFSTRYNGLESFVQFTARSKSGITGTTPPIGLSLLKITRGEFEHESRYVGEQYSFQLTIANFGVQPATINSIRLYANGDLLQPTQITPTLSREIPALTNEVFTITGAVPALPNQTITVDAAFTARFGDGVVGDSVPNLDQLSILAAEGVSLVAGSFSPEQATAGRSYNFALAVRNDSDDELRLTTTTTLSLVFADSDPLVLTLPSTVVVAANAGVSTLEFPPVVLPTVAPQLVDNISIRLVGNLGTVAFDQTLPVNAELLIQSAPAIAYVAGSLSPQTLYRGTDVAFTLEATNTGTATMTADVLATELTMHAVGKQITVKLGAESLILAPGEAQLIFKQLTVPQDIASAIDSFAVVVSGSANGHAESSRFKIPGSEVSIPFGAAVKLMDVALQILNPPYVNLGQTFSIETTIRNTGDEDLEEIVVRLTSNGNSEFDGEQTIDALATGRDTTVVFTVEAAFQSTISELFSMTVVSAAGATSGLAALVEPPQGNPTEVVVIQTPASLNLESQISAPPSAQDGILGLGETFTISASVLNSGQASTGSGELTLGIVSGGFTLNGAASRSFDVGQTIDWQITAPADDDTGLIVIAISQTPNDLNIVEAARLLDRADTIVVISSESQVAIGLDFTAAPLQLLSPGNEYAILDLSFSIVGEAEQPYLEFLEFEIHDRQGATVAPTTVISSSELSLNNQHIITGAAVGDAMRFALGPGYGVPRNATLTVAIAATPQLEDFSFYLDSNSVAASYETAAGTKPVPISAEFSSTLMIEREYTVVAQDLAASFFSYPNPFSPLQEKATLVYNLEALKAATIKIYSLTGEEILTREIPAPESLAEPVRFEWDGRNNDGHIVLNGVYLAVLSVPGEGEVRTKIAVVK